MADLAKLVEEIKGMTVLELSTLVKTLETEFGVSAAAPTAVVAAAAVGGEAAKAEEKTDFTVVMTDCGAQKLAVIKVVRALFPELSLPDAKKAVESVPFTVKENVEKEEADKLAAALKEAGATVELK